MNPKELTKLVFGAVILATGTLMIDDSTDHLHNALANYPPPTTKDLFNQYSATFKFNDHLMPSICKKENPKQDPTAVFNNKDKKGKVISQDVGLCQVNIKTAKSIDPKITIEDLKIPEVNIAFSYKVMKQKLDRTCGKNVNVKADSDNALRRYNGYASTKTNLNYSKDVICIWAYSRN